MKQNVETSAPAREERLHAGIAFGGTCGELRCSLNKGGTCLSTPNRAFSETYGCQFTLSLGIINTLRNAVVIMHGPIGCGYCSTATTGTGKTYKRLRDPGSSGTIWLSSNLDESDVIGGGEEKLKEAVLFADREYRPEIIVVVSSCVPALVGDDVDAILENLQSDTAARLIACNCEGFKTKIMATAYDAAYNGIMKGITEPYREWRPLTESDQDRAEREFRISRTVNVFNVGSMSRTDELELERLLNAVGLNVNFLPCYAEPDDFQTSLEAALNVSVCGTHDDYYLKYLRESFGIPYLIDTIPIGKKNVARWLRKIAEFFHLEKETEDLIALEEAALEEGLAPFREKLRGKRVYIGGGEVRILATASIAQDLGMEIVGLKGHHVDEFLLPLFETLDNAEEIPINIATQHPFEQANVIERVKPDVIIIHTGGNSISAKHGLPLLPLFSPSINYLGYSGEYEMARRLSRIIRNPSLNRHLSRFCPKPFKQSWYQENPFKYIRDK
ncbi:Nitrogenase molybdenum-iron protein, alpha and beta chain [uncultured Eubacteriales bacterium]|uniref:Nitrogenase molybdenum-iron protein, alpha and beta chain n=1 Tax=uncultured Eubacteriales bacterium TaxID=172733 RepID=A0A212JDF6_9FIRM|nr:Nitrogenase molybdenum-iron protein, alpha and beta chain [uncultured Eubacteriales bacterium]